MGFQLVYSYEVLFASHSSIITLVGLDISCTNNFSCVLQCLARLCLFVDKYVKNTLIRYLILKREKQIYSYIASIHKNKTKTNLLSAVPSAEIETVT